MVLPPGPGWQGPEPDHAVGVVPDVVAEITKPVVNEVVAVD